MSRLSGHLEEMTKVFSQISQELDEKHARVGSEKILKFREDKVAVFRKVLYILTVSYLIK